LSRKEAFRLASKPTDRPLQRQPISHKAKNESEKCLSSPLQNSDRGALPLTTTFAIEQGQRKLFNEKIVV
jgi:hypothetical protein